MKTRIKTSSVVRFLKAMFREKFISLCMFLILFAGTVSAEPLSNFAFYNLKEERIILSSFLGNLSDNDVLILNFTGSTCNPCKEQVPILLDLTKRTNVSLAGKGKVFLWVVFVGDDFRTGKEYSEFLKLQNAAEVLIDPLSSSYSQVRIAGLPTVLILNSKREILFKSEGFQESSTAALKRFLDSLGK
ncbi:TlpA family protein disulfide reductase [Leptospira sanjuanensis]|uniref:TlpA family protein disulfide reductase n=1 Tax=Leptospira sanjuanensis TaxID=2879643 RepID=UPI003872C6FB